jgi:hypothetical protein
MLPILIFELVWKTIWIIAFGLPRWRQGLLPGDFADTMVDCLSLVILIPLIPWDYIWKTYIRVPGDPWRARVQSP